MNLLDLFAFKCAYREVALVHLFVVLQVLDFIDGLVVGLHVGHGHFLGGPVSLDLLDVFAGERLLELVLFIVVFALLNNIGLFVYPGDAAADFGFRVFCLGFKDPAVNTVYLLFAEPERRRRSPDVTAAWRTWATS